MANDPVTDAVNSAKRTLSKAYNFTASVEGQPVSQNFAPKKIASPKIPQAKNDYSLPHAARKESGDTFMGVKSNQAPELNEAQRSREEAKKALDQ